MKRTMMIVFAFVILCISAAAIAEEAMNDSVEEVEVGFSEDFGYDYFDDEEDFDEDFYDFFDDEEDFDEDFEDEVEEELEEKSDVAEVHATPYVNSFARLKVEYDETVDLYTLTLSKPVDRLLVNWGEVDAEPEEVYFNDGLVCYFFGTGHKYRPGSQQRLVTAMTVETINLKVFNEGKEDEYIDVGSRTVDTQKDPVNGKIMIYKTITYQPVEELKYGDDVQAIISQYERTYPDLDYEIVLPEIVYYEKTDGTDQWGNPNEPVKIQMVDDKGNVVTTKGYIKGYSETIDYHPFLGTTLYGPKLVAFMTVQGDWAVCYNFKGQVIDISYYTGQF